MSNEDISQVIGVVINIIVKRILKSQSVKGNYMPSMTKKIIIVENI
jgi:hypothetical protein